MSRFLWAYDPNLDEPPRVLVLDRGPEVKGKRGDHLRPQQQATVVAECNNENTALRIVMALEQTPGDTEVDPYEEPF